MAGSADDGGRVPDGAAVGQGRRGDGTSLGSTVYRELRDRLMKGQFQPDDRLRIRDLAALLGTSVTPVRDAVLRLVQDRALVMRSQRDIRVPVLTEGEYLEIRDIRVSLERLSVETAARVADGALLEELGRLTERNRSAIEAGDLVLSAGLNQEFHFRIADGAGMPRLRLILERLWLQIGPLVATAYREAGLRTIEEHHAIIAAIGKGDGAAAAQAVRRDIVDGGAAILERVREVERAAAATRSRGKAGGRQRRPGG